MNFGLEDNIIRQIQTVFSHYPQIEKVVIYGSRAKGNYKKGSDIDLTLSGSEINFNIISKLEEELDDLLLPYTFDISIRSDIDNHNLIEHIERIGSVFYNHADTSFTQSQTQP